MCIYIVWDPNVKWTRNERNSFPIQCYAKMKRKKPQTKLLFRKRRKKKENGGECNAKKLLMENRLPRNGTTANKTLRCFKFFIIFFSRFSFVLWVAYGFEYEVTIQSFIHTCLSFCYVLPPIQHNIISLHPCFDKCTHINLFLRGM